MLDVHQLLLKFEKTGHRELNPGRGKVAHQHFNALKRDSLPYFILLRNINPAIPGETAGSAAYSTDASKHRAAQKPSKNKTSIRERLRQWQLEHQTQPSWDEPRDITTGTIGNSLTRTQATGSFDRLFRLEDESGDFASSGSKGEHETELSVVGVAKNNPGDLVELRQPGSRMAILGIFLGSFGNRHHFYGSNGRWITSMGFFPIFSVSNFVGTAELAPMLAKIPQDGNPDVFDEMRRKDEGPTQEDGISLLHKMSEFRLQAERIYQANLARLEGAQALLSQSRARTYLSIFEMADELLPTTLKTTGGFPPAALYAVHTAIHRDETAFHALSPSADRHRQNHIFEVSPLEEAQVRDRVATIVRHHIQVQTEAPPNSKRLESTPLAQFVRQARPVVLASREERPLTSHGMIRAPKPFTLQRVIWSETSKDILSFLESWASYDLFDHGSRFHAYGATILRALNLYNDFPLNQATAWTFLQEIGFIPPWEIHARYKARFPHVDIVSGGGLSRHDPGEISQSIRPDIAADSRRVRDDTVFCIDAPSTIVIDDGVSLERTDSADAYWIHIHTADPASGILPNSSLGKFLELIPENIYLPGHFQAMLPSNMGAEDSKDYESRSLVERFSLHAHGPALTFSAKVNSSGDILDYKVEPSILKEVKYLDPDDVSRFCKEPPPPIPPKDRLMAGTPPISNDSTLNRPMVAAEDLDASSKNDLLQLHRLVEAVKQRRSSNGAWPYFFPKPSVTVKFEDASSPDLPSDALVVPAEPYIDVAYTSSVGASVVANSMVLAGEIAARWCYERGIPIPYRRDIGVGKNHAAALEYVNKQLYPLIKQGIEPTAAQRSQLTNLIGGVEISSSPGPFFMLGLDMYAKATSPLRRFSDLLVHWQVHAALDFERRTGRAVDPAVDNLDEILPFTHDQLAKILPFLQLRERMARVVSRGQYDWILIALVRAWKFEKTTPSTFRFKVATRIAEGLRGQLDFFDLNATLLVGNLNGTVLKRDVSVGDEFEVELADINVRSRHIHVRALKYLSGKGREGSGLATLEGNVETPQLENLRKPTMESMLA
ncbi:Mitochondrial protein cyt-4 [Paramyrothecium foliicola]|nr:Mitochondrial protein cyt-4 [Paramyrothecium foliicola]